MGGKNATDDLRKLEAVKRLCNVEREPLCKRFGRICVYSTIILFAIIVFSLHIENEKGKLYLP